MRQAARLRALEMQDIDYDAAVALLAFIGSKPKGIALSGEIVSLLREKPYNFSLKHIADLLKYLSQSKFVCVGGVVERRHPLGNLPIQLSSMLERKESTTIH
ncbi:MAG: hypothetical protein HYT62_05125 [Candidatus Yanofskybacteria bacterium]|nr:hypothetical protein [Candidatus Yanofskybacteria bacterium]